MAHDAAVVENDIEAPATSSGFEITVSRDDLLREITLAALIVPAKVTIPILGSIHLLASGDTVALTSTSLDLTIRTQCKAEIRQEGVCTIPARKLHDYVRLLPEGKVSLKLQSNGSVLVRSGRSSAKLHGLGAESFPGVQVSGRDGQVSLPAQKFRALIKRAAIAVGGEESNLHAAQLELAKGAMRLVATDGHRLAIVLAPILDSGTHEPILIPAAALKGLAKLIADSDSDVLVSQAGTSLYFAVGERRLAVRKLTVKFPNYSKAVQVYDTPGVTVPVDILKASMARTMLFSDRVSGCAVLQFTSDAMQVKCASSDAGESEEVIEILGGPQQELRIGFNGAYLKDLMELLDEHVTLKFRDSQSALVCEADFDDESHLMYLVMPMRIPNEGGR